SPRAAFLLLASAGLTLYAALNYQNADIERYYFLPVAILVALAALGAQLVLWSRIPAVHSLQIVTPALAVVPIALLALNSGRSGTTERVRRHALRGEGQRLRPDLSVGAAPPSLALRLDDDGHFRRQARIDLHRDLVGAERLEGLFEVDLVAVDRDTTTAECVCDVLRRDRAVQLAAFAYLHTHRQGSARNAGGHDVGLLALSLPLVFAIGDVVLPCTIGTACRGHGELARVQEVLGVAIGDALELTALADCGDG